MGSNSNTKHDLHKRGSCTIKPSQNRCKPCAVICGLPVSGCGNLFRRYYLVPRGSSVEPAPPPPSQLNSCKQQQSWVIITIISHHAVHGLSCQPCVIKTITGHPDNHGSSVIMTIITHHDSHRSSSQSYMVQNDNHGSS